MTNAPTTNGAPTAYDCGVCDGSGTVEIFDVCTGLLIDSNYCVCPRGVHLRHADDFATKRLLDTTNARLAGITLPLLERIRAGLLTLPMGGAA